MQLNNLLLESGSVLVLLKCVQIFLDLIYAFNSPLIGLLSFQQSIIFSNDCQFKLSSRPVKCDAVLIFFLDEVNHFQT